MRIVKEKFLRDAAEAYPKAASYLAAWTQTVRQASWRSLADVRANYPAADLVRVRSVRPVIVFNVCGNTYRLIVALDFDGQMVSPVGSKGTTAGRNRSLLEIQNPPPGFFM